MGIFQSLARLRGRSASAGGDQALLDLIRRDPPTGWRRFLDRYAGRILGWIRDLGPGEDEAMECFVFVCEKLAERDCRRLREVRRLGTDGELVPWLRQVVRRQFVSWMWSKQGRLRLPTAIEALGTLEHEVFRLHYWQGLRASEIDAQLRAQGTAYGLGDIYLALDAVHSVLSDTKKWRLVSRLTREAPVFSLDTGGVDGPAYEPAAVGRDPEGQALLEESRRQLRGALGALEPRDRLLVKLRFEDGLGTGEIAQLLSESPATVRRQLKRSLADLRESLHPPYRSRTA